MQLVKRSFAALMTLALLSAPAATAGQVDPPDDEVEAPDSDDETASGFDVELDDTTDDIGADTADSVDAPDDDASASASDGASDSPDGTADEPQGTSDDGADESDDKTDQADDATDDAEDSSEDSDDESKGPGEDAEDKDEDRSDDSDDKDDQDETRSSASDEDKDERAGRAEKTHGSDSDDDEENAGTFTDLPVEYDGEGYAVAAREVLALSGDEADRDMLQALGFTVKAREALPGLGLELLSISIPDDRSADSAIARLASRKSNSIYALNHVFMAGRLVQGPAPAKRPQSRLYPDATVGIIDGGVARSALPAHVKLEAVTFATKRTAANDHGSAVAALLAEAGVSRIYAANVFDGRSASTAAMVRALDWMAVRKVPVINISLAGPPNPIVHHVIKIMRSRGHVIVAAVGNGGPAAPPLFPGAYPEVIAVTAVDSNGGVYRRANRGPQTVLAADGVGVAAVDARGALRTVSGTSFAAPVVSALLARSIHGLDPATSNQATASLIRSARDLGAPGRDPIYGYGWVGHGN